MKKALTVIPMLAVLVVALLGLNEYSERKLSKDILSSPLYIGVMNGATGEYIYISDKESMQKIIDGVKDLTSPVINLGEGYLYYVDIFSDSIPGNSVRYALQEKSEGVVSQLDNYYKSSTNYKKDRLYAVQNMSAGPRYQIKLRYTDTAGYYSDNQVMTISNTMAVDKILSSLKDIRFKYDRSKPAEGSKRFWIQVYYDNRQVLHEEFLGSKVIRNGEEYVVANPDIVNSLYYYIQTLRDKEN